jgi:hypothetical protein
VTAVPVEKVNGTTLTVEPRFDPVALAEAEAIRTRAAAEAAAARIKAEGEAKAAELLAAEEAEKQRLENEKNALANERAALRFQRERAEQLAKIAEADRKREETERAREQARRQEAQEGMAEVAKAAAAEKSSKRWRNVALGFYALCAAVALPVQMAAFYDPGAKYLLVAPVFIEVIALVALVGAAAAVTAGRPQWHYRLVAWAGALTAATINIVHGLEAFDPATAFGTALASVAGPGMWDLHEHGRIRKREGKSSWRQRRAERKAAKEEADEKAAEAERKAAEKEAADKAAAEAARQLAEARAKNFPKVWQHALRLAAAIGETTVTEAVWKRAHRDVEGTEPIESADVIRMRNAAEARVEAARQKKPVSALSRTANAQRVPQVPHGSGRGSKTGPKVRGVRRSGDSPRFAEVARRQAAITAKDASAKQGGDAR